MIREENLRCSPMLSVKGREEDLAYAPAPWRLKECVETGMIFLANPPAYEELNETFAYEVTFARESQARRQAEPIRYAVSAMLKRFRANVLRRNKILGMLQTRIARSPSNSINVLDVGCGWGDLLQQMMTSLPSHLRERVIPHGVEISRALAQLSGEKLIGLGGRCVHASAHDGLQQFPEDFFDVIVMSSYLEHEAKPLAVLEKCRARLKKNGVIIVKVPNFSCINRKIRGAKWCGFRWPDHVNYFTPTTLADMSKRAGLDVVRMSLLDAHPFSDNMYALLRARA
mgnify:CR=1 FL=1